MTTPHDPRDPVLTEEEEREVAALLADAEGTGPVTTPPEVVTRLDDVLAGLVAERAPAAAAGGATVVPLAGRRQRRWPRVLLAAAAVVAGGYAVQNVASDVSGGDGAADSAGGASSAEDAAGGGQVDSQELGDRDSGLSGEGRMTVAPTVRRDHLATDVRRVVRTFGRPVTSAPGEDPTAGSADPDAGGTVDETRDCPVPRLTDGQRFYEVRYRGAPAGLVVGPPRKGSVGVTVYACEDGGVRLDRTVPAP